MTIYAVHDLGVKRTLLIWGYNKVGKQMKGDRIYTCAAGNISDHWRPNTFLKINTEDYKTRDTGSLFQHFMTRTENVPLLRQKRHCPYSNL